VSLGAGPLDEGRSADEPPLHVCRARGLLIEGGSAAAKGPLAARRGKLIMGADGLSFGNWRVPYVAIDEARLASFRQMLVPGRMLVLTVGPRVYRFGFRPAPFWEGDLPFDVQRVAGRVRRGVLGWCVTLLVGAVLAAVAVGALKAWS